jgi:hypothetical protein
LRLPPDDQTVIRRLQVGKDMGFQPVELDPRSPFRFSCSSVLTMCSNDKSDPKTTKRACASVQ